MTLRRILVTGAAGFVGRHLLPALRAAFPEAELLEAGFDVTDRAAVSAEVASARPEAVVHLAAIAAPSEARQDPDLAWRVNLGGTLNVARAVLAGAPGCTLLFASSADAYGASFRQGVAVDERAALAPQNTYGATKAAADLALGAMAAEGLRCIRMRPFNHTGVGQSDAFVVPAFARQVARIAAGLQERVLHVGALEPMRDFLDVRDVCAAYVAALIRRDALAPGAIVNVASGEARRIGDVLAALLELAEVSAEIRTDTARLRPSDIAVAVGDAGLARRELGWAPVIPWSQTLAGVLADWRVRVGEP
ncbi:MAG: GDP-mannose 4,6-dehydratase [Acetobacteraceae bacterium]